MRNQYIFWSHFCLRWLILGSCAPGDPRAYSEVADSVRTSVIIPPIVNLLWVLFQILRWDCRLAYSPCLLAACCRRNGPSRRGFVPTSRKPPENLVEAISISKCCMYLQKWLYCWVISRVVHNDSGWGSHNYCRVWSSHVFSCHGFYFHQYHDQDHGCSIF